MRKVSLLDIFADFMGGALCLACFIFLNRATLISGGWLILISPSSTIFWNLFTMIICLVVISYSLETSSNVGAKNYFVCLFTTLGVYFTLVTFVKFLIAVDYDPCVAFYLLFQSFVAASIGKKEVAAAK